MRRPATDQGSTGIDHRTLPSTEQHAATDRDEERRIAASEQHTAFQQVACRFAGEVIVVIDVLRSRFPEKGGFRWQPK
jgi:hypothetical protein